MPSVTPKSKASTKTSLPPHPGNAMEIASLHQACLQLEHHAMSIYANAPSKHAAVSKVLQEAAVKLRDFKCPPEVDCGDGYKDCDGMCIPNGEGCPPFAPRVQK